MIIVTEKDIRGGVSLVELWKQYETFILLPDKSGSSKEWIEKINFSDKFCKNHFMLLTSGSTGRPKLVVGLKKRAEKLAEVLHDEQQSEPCEETILLLPLSYCYAFVNQWLWSALFNRIFVFTDGFKAPDDLGEKLKNANNAMFCLVGAQVPFLSEYFKGKTFDGVIRLHFAGGSFPQEHMGAIKKFFPNAEIFNNYGCAEAMPRLAIRPLDASLDGSNIGRPIKGVKLAVNQNGEMIFNSPYAAVGFYDESGFNGVSNDGYISTGDIGSRQPDGSWLVAGRSNEVFKRYGEKVAVSEVFKTLKEEWSSGISFYREKDSRGEDGYVVVLSPKPASQEVKKIKILLRKNYSRVKWPLRIESVGCLPLLANGKIDLLELSDMCKVILWKQGI